MAQQHSHIPKFGSWDGDNVPYTAYFENAQKQKGSDVRMNPNDPEENPEAFMMFRGGNDDANSDIFIFAEKNQKNNGSMKSMTSESSTDKSTTFDYSVQTSNYKSKWKKSANKQSNTFCPSSPEPNRRRHGYNPADDIVSHRSASVPMFGAWDEKDPTSGEGFTVIFQKVKEEKQIAGIKKIKTSLIAI